MKKVKRIRNILTNKRADRNGYWSGYPAEKTLELYSKALGIKPNYLALAKKIGDDFLWLPGETCWNDPDNKEIFNITGGKKRESLSQPGVFADCEDTKEIDSFDWPDPGDFNYKKLGKQLKGIKLFGFAAMSGMWAPFFHIADAFFGMENYYCKMFTHPAVVEAVTEHIVDFYVEANRRYFSLYAKKIDCYFFGNDFGSQRDLLISPEMFTKFILPSLKRLIDCAKSFGLPVMLHSCGSIARIIPTLIDSGIDALHPLQAKAFGMDAESLAQYKDDIVFVGGVDTQDLLPFKSPADVRAEVLRLREIFGSGYIVSPSHEALLPNVPVENLIAMRDAAIE